MKGKANEFRKFVNQIRQIAPVDYPELIIGIAAPIGANLESIYETISKTLTLLKYASKQVHLTKEMLKFYDGNIPIQPKTNLKNTHQKWMLQTIYAKQKSPLIF